MDSISAVPIHQACKQSLDSYKAQEISDKVPILTKMIKMAKFSFKFFLLNKAADLPD